ncbi:glycosyltransferase [Terrihabitans sp. B22-R8]|uniref:glycosyltransferase n=1 Tax=Terrihabitans sp. B22-R8 TaxID=3425128 RepID=UPI00403C4F83
MISVVIPSLENEDALIGTLSALVPAAADGTVRDVVVVDGSSSERIRKVAEGCGCVYAQGPGGRAGRLAEGIRRAKGAWLLLVEPGGEPDAAWTREARLFVEREERKGATPYRAAVFTVEGEEDAEGLIARLGHLVDLRVRAGAVLVHRSLLEAIGGVRPVPGLEYADLVQRIGGRRLVRLRSRLFIPAAPDVRARPKPGFGRVLGAGLLALRVPARFVARFYS